jgi:hypothetical protein
LHLRAVEALEDRVGVALELGSVENGVAVGVRARKRCPHIERVDVLHLLERSSEPVQVNAGTEQGRTQVGEGQRDPTPAPEELRFEHG